jgi:hypothetical protein
VATAIAITRALTTLAVTVAHAFRTASHAVLLIRGDVGLYSAHPRSIVSAVVVGRASDRKTADSGDREKGDSRSAREGSLQCPP